MARVFWAGFWLSVALAAGQPQQKKTTSAPVKEQEPPEEDESLKPKVYSLNPLEASRSVTAGNFYFKKRNYRAAAKRYLDATLWDPGSAEAFLRLAEADEHQHKLAEAREAYTKYLTLAPQAKNADQIRQKIAKWPDK